MNKFLTVLKREYMQRVRAKMFIVSTILLPVVMSGFGIVPAIIMTIETPPMRVAVVDQTGRMFIPLKQALYGDDSEQEARTDGTPRRRFASFVLEQVSGTNQPLDQIRAQLDQRLRARELDGYLILPPDFLNDGEVEFFNRNPGDLLDRKSVV